MQYLQGTAFCSHCKQTVNHAITDGKLNLMYKFSCGKNNVSGRNNFLKRKLLRHFSSFLEGNDMIICKYYLRKTNAGEQNSSIQIHMQPNMESW